MPIPLLPDFRFEAPAFLWLALPVLALLAIAGRRGAGSTITFPALELFGDRTRAMLERVADSEQPIASIEAFFEHTTFAVPGWRVNAGCMMVNSILELADVDQELCQLAARKLQQIEDLFAELLSSSHPQPQQAAV